MNHSMFSHKTVAELPCFIKMTERGYLEVYAMDKGDKRKEYLHQIDSASHWRVKWPDVAICHIVNEGSKLPAQYRKKLREMGLEKGASDIQVNHRSHCGRFGFAAVELKRSTKTLASEVSDEQERWLKKSITGGGIGVVCYGWKSFMIFMRWYLDGVID